MTSERITPRWVLAAMVTLGLVLLGYAVVAKTGLGGGETRDFFSAWVYSGLELGACALCIARVILRSEDRVAWLLFAAGLVSWTLGDLMWLLVLERPEAPPLWVFRTVDVLYLAMYPLFYCGLLLLMRSRLRPFRTSLWLDGLAVGLTLAALASVLVLGTVLGGASGDTPWDTVVAVGYPVGDMLLVIVAVAAIGMTGWRPGSAWTLVALGPAIGAVADSVFAYQEIVGSYASGGIVDVLWPASMVVTSVAAWRPLPRGMARAESDGRIIALPAAAALTSLGLLIYDHYVRVTELTLVLASAGLLAALARAGLTFLENARMLRHSEHEAMTDGLSGLPNRRRLMVDLDSACGDPNQASTLIFFDLDGFKQYNDSFGHNAGDALLARLGGTLGEALVDSGFAYRLGGDEFCALLVGRHAEDDPVVLAAVGAFSEIGGGFAVTASWGLVVLPDEAANPNEALALADERMYAHKRRGRETTRHQARSVLLQVQSEREPDVHEHARSVAELALGVGERMAMAGEQLDVVARAAELHDIGKVAIPEEILRKQGPLDEREWEFVRQHTVIGERILAAAPALVSVGRIVRASHERWDGNGYPDGLRGEAIPLEARLVSVCDSFHAMVSDRPYRAGMGVDEALSELEACAGTQFDPGVVEAFTAYVRAGMGAEPSQGTAREAA